MLCARVVFRQNWTKNDIIETGKPLVLLLGLAILSNQLHTFNTFIHDYNLSQDNLIVLSKKVVCILPMQSTLAFRLRSFFKKNQSNL